MAYFRLPTAVPMDNTLYITILVYTGPVNNKWHTHAIFIQKMSALCQEEAVV